MSSLFSRAFFRFLALSALTLIATGCGSNSITSSLSLTPLPTPACVPASPQEFAYQLTGDGQTVSMFTQNSCTGAFTATTPATISTGISPGQIPAEDIAVDPLGRFLYVANLVSNASPGQATIAMFTI